MRITLLNGPATGVVEQPDQLHSFDVHITAKVRILDADKEAIDRLAEAFNAAVVKVMNKENDQ